MTISALNTWRKAYLVEVLLATALHAPVPDKRSLYQRSLRLTLIAGATLWLIHDTAHGRWKTAAADAAALAALLKGQPGVALAAVAYAVANPERPPSPFIWSWRPQPAAERAPAAHPPSAPDRRGAS